MTGDTLGRSIFAAICVLGMCVIASGCGMELLRMKRGDSLLRVSQLRLRVASALIWIIMLGSLAFSVAFLWPKPGDLVAARKFLSVFSGSMALLLIALALLGYDMVQVGKQRRLKEKEFKRQLDAMAQQEIDNIEREHRSPANHS